MFQYHQQAVAVVLLMFQLVWSKTAVAEECLKPDSGLAIFSSPPISNDPIKPNLSLEKIKGLQCEVNIIAAANSFEPVSIVILGHRKTSSKISLSIDALVHANNQDLIPLENIELKWVKMWYQANGAWHGIGRPAIKADRARLVPELLLHDPELVQVDHKRQKNSLRVNKKNVEVLLDKSNTRRVKKIIKNLDPDYSFDDSDNIKPITIAPSTLQQAWATIQVPENQVPGSYQGKLTVENNQGKEVASIKINLEVLPFELKPPNQKFTMYYHGRLHESGKPSISSYFKSEQQLRTELKDMRDHGISNPIVYQPHYPTTKLLKRYLTIREELGFDNKQLYFIYLNTNDVNSFNSASKMKNNIRQVREITEPFGTKEIFIYGKDEAKGEALIEQKEAWRIARKMGVKIYAAGYEGTFEAVGELLDEFVLARSPMPFEAQKFHSIGKKIFSYANPQSGVENPYIYRINYGLRLWAANFDGAMVYSYQHSMGDGWNDFDFSYRDHNFTYPTTSSIIKTIGWEGLREGIDDLRYLGMLQDELAKVKKTDDSHRQAIAIEARRFLDQLSAQLNRQNKSNKPSALFVTDLDKIRKRIIDYFLVLASSSTMASSSVETGGNYLTRSWGES